MQISIKLISYQKLLNFVTVVQGHDGRNILEISEIKIHVTF